MKRYDHFIIFLKGGNDTRATRAYAKAHTCQYFLSSLWAEGIREDKAHP